MVKKDKALSKKIDLFRIAYFILLNTMVFQEVLSNQFPKIKPLHKIRKNFIAEFADQWEMIQDEINYKPIFKLSVQILEAIPNSNINEQIMGELKNQAQSIVSSGAHLRHDLMGRIYHKLLLQTMGGYYATYYTSVPAAVLLSDLQIKTPNPAWDFSSLEFFEEFKVIDPSCGSGTLLSAVYSTLKDQFIILHKNTTYDDLKELHRVLIEDDIYGLDILDYATHLTLITLALQNTQAKFQKSKIYTVPDGMDPDGTIYLGSLTLLEEQTILPVKRWGESPTDQHSELDFLDIIPNMFDVVIMNPPFSRSANPNLKFGYASKDVRKKMGDKLKKVTRELGLEGLGVAGLGGYFIVAGDNILKENGRIGIVIPRSILSGVSWSKVRDILQEKYCIEYIISNFDPGTKTIKGWCWSENTDIGEVLIIARKTCPNVGNNCLFVNITKRPANEFESLLVSQYIRTKEKTLKNTLPEKCWTNIDMNNTNHGFIYRVNQKELEQNWLHPCLFAHPQLDEFCLELFNNNEFVKLGGYLTSKGTDISNIKKNFASSSTQTTYPILYGLQNTMNTMKLDDRFIGYGTPKKGKTSESLHEKFASKLLIAERPHISNDCLLALELNEGVLATAFWEIGLSNPEIKPLLLLWLNSTFGFFLALGAGANSQGTIFKIKQDHLKDILIPNPTEDIIKDSKDKYEEIINEVFHSYKEEFELAINGQGVKYKIDQFFKEQLNIETDLTPIYRLLVNEPALTMERLDENQTKITEINNNK